MVLEQNRDGRTLVIALKENLDILSVPEVMTIIENDLDDVDRLVFDVSDLDYSSSAGLRMFLMAQQIMDDKEGKMEIVGLNDILKDIFTETGFINILTVVSND